MKAKELRELDAELYTPAQVAAVLHWDPQYIRIMAREQPEELPFRVMVHRRRVQIPAEGFWSWWDGRLER